MAPLRSGCTGLLTDRSGEKGDRDLLVAVALLDRIDERATGELVDAYCRLAPEHRHHVRSNATLLSLLDPRVGMPDPRPRRALVAALVARLESDGLVQRMWKVRQK